MNDLALRVLRVFEEHNDSIFWRVNGDRVTFFVICNDLFFWACADAEEVTDENIEALERTHAFVKEQFAKHPKPDRDSPEFMHWDVVSSWEAYWPLLFCCRVRGMRPQRPYYESIPAVMHDAFNACGPERTE